MLTRMVITLVFFAGWFEKASYLWYYESDLKKKSITINRHVGNLNHKK